MRVLVTGGAGFFGSYIIAALEEAGCATVAFDRQPRAEELEKVAPSRSRRLRIGSIGEPDRLMEVCRNDRIDTIVHAAGRVGQEASVADPTGFYQTNVFGTLNVLETARRLGLCKVVLISSSSVYLQAESGRFTEADAVFSTHRAHPSAHYGVSKMASEAMGMVYADFHGLEFIALRVAALYGFGMRMPLFVKPMVENAVRGIPTTIETGGPLKRDYTHVRDASRAVALAVAHPPLPPNSQRVFNIAAGATRSGSELAEIVRRVVLGADIEIGNRLTQLERASAETRASLDSTAALQTFGWQPEFDITAGIQEYVEQFRAYVNAG